MAFVAGFNNAAVQRLKFTRAELSNKALRVLFFFFFNSIMKTFKNNTNSTET